MGYDENVEASRSLAAFSDLVLQADADTAYGNALNVFFTVRGFEYAGVAALMIEDQVLTCRYVDGQQGFGHPFPRDLPDVKERMTRLGDDPVVMGPAPFAAFIQEGIPRWTKVICSDGFNRSLQRFIKHASRRFESQRFC